MNNSDTKRLKMAWLAAQEAGDQQAQLKLLLDHPAAMEELVEFMAAYYATGGDAPVEQEVPLLEVTQRACQSALGRVFEKQAAFASLSELRKSLHLKKTEVARALRLSVDIWNKFEAGVIELGSLSQRQLERLAQYFHVSTEQFGTLLTNSQPAISFDRRQTLEGAREEQQGPQRQSFAEAIARSTMTKEDQDYWLE